jgi:hypothetical protein
MEPLSPCKLLRVIPDEEVSALIALPDRSLSACAKYAQAGGREVSAGASRGRTRYQVFRRRPSSRGILLGSNGHKKRLAYAVCRALVGETRARCEGTSRSSCESKSRCPWNLPPCHDDSGSNSRMPSITMGRGNARQKLVRDDAERRQLIDGLKHTFVRQGCELLCYDILENHRGCPVPSCNVRAFPHRFSCHIPRRNPAAPHPD